MSAKRVAVMLGIVLCAAGMAAAQTEWVEYGGNPVVPAPDPSVWALRYTSEVLEVDGTYHMYFVRQPVGAPACGLFEICHATSTDGLEWEMDAANPVLSPGEDGEWDDGGLSLVAVIHDDSGFRMWFGGGDGETARVGYATSVDGSAWTEYENNPIIDVGPTGSFDDQWVLPGTVIAQDGLYRMWYHGSKNVGSVDYEWKIGYAESTDGLEWVKHPSPVLEPGAGWDDWLVYAPSVILDGAGYHMWFTGTDGTHTFGIGYAVSVDGIEWVKHRGNPVLGFSEGEVGVGHPAVLHDAEDGEFRMWFTDYNPGSELSFGFATSECCEPLAYLTVVPAAGYAAGAEGSFYRTDLDLSNRSDSAVEYQLWWLPRDEDNTVPVISERFTLAGGKSVRYANVLSEVFDLEPDSLGALALVSSSPDLLSMSRIYNAPSGEPAGTYGQAMPAVAPGDMMQSGERRRILFASENAEMRANIGCQSASEGTAVVNVELFDSEGTSLDRLMMILPAFGNDQLNRPFEDYAPVDGYVEVWTDVGNRQIYCYGSVLDNITSDPTTIPPQ